MKTTRYFAVSFTEHPAPAPKPEDFTPWINSEGGEEMSRLVLHRAVRLRGGIRERTPVTVFETEPAGAVPGEAKSARLTAFTLHP